MTTMHDLLYDFNYFDICIQIAFYSHLSGLWGHDSLRTASMVSELKFDLTFKISELNYPGTYVHVAF